MVNIYRGSNIIFSTPINKGSKKKVTLMKEDYITLKFSVATPIYFQLGDYINDGTIGLYEIVEFSKPTHNKSTGAYDYELRLDAYYWKWKNKIFKYTPSILGREESWNLTAALNVQMDVFLANLKALGYTYKGADFTYSIDFITTTNGVTSGTVANKIYEMSYDSTNLIDALTDLCGTDKWNCEWWIEGSVIHFGKCESGTDVEFEVGKNCQDMKQSESSSDFATRVYAFGSTKNITERYRRDLIFSVTDIADKTTTRHIISDSGRTLLQSYFKASARSYGFNETHTLPTSSYVISGNTAKITMQVAFGSTGIVGNDYEADLTGLVITCMPTVQGVSNVKCDVWIGENDGTKLSNCHIVDGLEYTPTISAPTKNLPDKYFNCGNVTYNGLTLIIEVTATYGANVQDPLFGFTLTGGFTIKSEYQTAACQATFLTGSLKGNTYDAVYNPNYTSAGTNQILLPDAISPTKGDTYQLSNLMIGAVPVKYFTKKEGSDLVTNGVLENRLMLPEACPYIDAKDGMTEEEIVERVLVYEDIFPQMKDHAITAVTSDTGNYQENGVNTGQTYPIFTVTDKNLDFSNDYIIPNEKLMITFQTGLLAGLSFEVEYAANQNGGSDFKIVHDNTYGRYMPDENSYPAVGDQYVLYNYDASYMDTTLTEEAEQQLLTQTKADALKLFIENSTYDCEMDPSVMYNSGTPISYGLGQKVKLINGAYFEDGYRESRIIGYEINLDIPYDTPTYTVGESSAYSRLGDLETKIDEITYNGNTYQGTNSGSGSSSGSSSSPTIYVIKKDDSTEFSDENVLSASRTVKEISNRSISKTDDDTAKGLITFLKGLCSKAVAIFEKGIKVIGGIITDSLSVTNKTDTTDLSVSNQAVIDKIVSSIFSSGQLGSGFTLYNQGGKSYMEIDELLVRVKAIFTSLEIRKLNYLGDNMLFTSAGCKIAKVEETDTTYKCYFMADDGTTATTNDFVVGDQVRCQTFNIKAGKYTNVSNKYYWRYVSAVGDGYIELSKTDCDANSDVPAAGDSLVQLGNRTDSTRQNAIMLEVSGENAPAMIQYSGICGYSLSGKDTTVISPNGNKFVAKSFAIQVGDSIVKIPAEKGEWIKDTPYSYYDRVSHNGSLWLCIIAEGKTTTDEPVDGSTSWQKQVSKGNDGETGVQGEKGDTGATGAKGDKGDKGDQGIQGLQGLQGEQGEQGIQGTKGDAGQTSYFHIKYSDSADGSNMNEDGGAYIGTYVDFTQADSIDKTKYTWVLVKGAQGSKGDQGIAGTNGSNGQTSYLHIAYSDSADGKTNFNQEAGAYIGQYVDFTQSDSTDYTKYNWTLIKGAKGDTGAQGNKGDTGNTGAKGDTGATGAKGDDGFMCTLSPESVTLNDDESGNVTNLSLATTIIKLLKGAEVITPTIIISATSGCSATISSNTVVITAIPQNTKQGYVDVLITSGSFNVTKRFSFQVIDYTVTKTIALNTANGALSLKADQKTVDDMGKTVDQNSLDISANAKAITLKMNSGDFESMIDQHANKINLTVKSQSQQIASDAANSIGKFYVLGTGLNHNAAPSVILNNTEYITSYARGHNLVTINRSNLSKVELINYDTYGSTANCDNLATKLNSLSSDVIVVLVSYDACQINANLANVLQGYGGSGKTFGADRIPYAFIGINGIGTGNGIEVICGSGASDPYAEYSTVITGGIPQGIMGANCVFNRMLSSFTIDTDGISLLGKKILLGGMITFQSLDSGAQKKITDAQGTADAAADSAKTANDGLGSLKNSLGGLAYEKDVEQAMKDKGIIDGAYIKMSLIDVAKVVAAGISAQTIDAQNATFKNLNVQNGKFTGELDGVTGSFQNLNCVDGNGKAIGGIAFDTTGIWINGCDFYHQGTYNKRGLRYYSSNIFCRGAFGHSSKAVAVVSGNIIRFYVNGYGQGDYVQGALKTYTYNGYTFYKIPVSPTSDGYSQGSFTYQSCYGNAYYGDVNGFQVDVVIIDNGSFSLPYYMLVYASQAKEVTVFNRNNAQDVVLAQTGGYRNRLPGGAAAHYIYWVDGDNGAINLGCPGDGWFGSGYNDNNW